MNRITDERLHLHIDWKNSLIVKTSIIFKSKSFPNHMQYVCQDRESRQNRRDARPKRLLSSLIDFVEHRTIRIWQFDCDWFDVIQNASVMWKKIRSPSCVSLWYSSTWDVWCLPPLHFSVFFLPKKLRMICFSPVSVLNSWIPKTLQFQKIMKKRNSWIPNSS